MKGGLPSAKADRIKVAKKMFKEGDNKCFDDQLKLQKLEVLH